MGDPAADATDAALVARMARGDRAALSALYSRHASRLLALAVHILRDRSEAEDLLHDVFLEAWQKAATFSEERGTVGAWLSLRARSRAIDRRRAASGAVYRAGDVHSLSGGTEHSFTIAPDEPCVAAAVHRGIRFSSLGLRLLAKIFGG